MQTETHKNVINKKNLICPFHFFNCIQAYPYWSPFQCLASEQGALGQVAACRQNKPFLGIVFWEWNVNGHVHRNANLSFTADTLNAYWNKLNPQDIMNFLSLLEWVVCTAFSHPVLLLSMLVWFECHISHICLCAVCLVRHSFGLCFQLKYIKRATLQLKHCDPLQKTKQ